MGMKGGGRSVLDESDLGEEGEVEAGFDLVEDLEKFVVWWLFDGGVLVELGVL